MKCSGFTLLEGLVSLLFALIVSAVVLPSFANMLARHRATGAVSQLAGAVHMTRHAAISLHRHVALCAAEGQRCLGSSDWHRGAMIFADTNQDGSRQQPEPVISQLPRLHRGARVYWRSFQNKPYIRFRANGATDWQNGSFLYCPPDGNPALARGLVINVQGRIARSQDRNGDGIDEDAQGRPLRCP